MITISIAQRLSISMELPEYYEIHDFTRGSILIWTPVYTYVCTSYHDFPL